MSGGCRYRFPAVRVNNAPQINSLARFNGPVQGAGKEGEGEGIKGREEMGEEHPSPSWN